MEDNLTYGRLDFIEAMRDFEAGKDYKGERLKNVSRNIAEASQRGFSSLGPKFIIRILREVLNEPSSYGFKSNQAMFARYSMIFLTILYAEKQYPEFLEFILELKYHPDEKIKTEAGRKLESMVRKGIISKEKLDKLEKELLE